MRGSRWVWSAAALLAIGGGVYWWARDRAENQASATASGAALPAGPRYESAHYRATSTATPEQTRAVLAAAEALHAAYLQAFDLKDEAGRAKHQLVLYGDRAQFRANNRSSAWAEAYYLAPTCYAYYAEGVANPYHWMVHEATHQLNHELAVLKPAKWVNEGLASYFGASRLEGGHLRPGTIDPDTYPIWWLGELGLSGDPEADIRQGRIVALRTLIAGTDRADLNRRFNQYYIGYWSLTHFLFHYEDGKYAAGFRALIRDGGTRADFERRIGPVETIQREWYDYLQEVAGGGEATLVRPIPPPRADAAR
ncbi:DUF1570 domain-containing protein [Lysobacter sp. cf310]|uniref:DUF1570 domain-containing protein n=1 Tax=Lysobacter sp. cf310 TaxID=1761790 RepID=UPI0008E75B98|nr:DUF1570 domain-containing protein [Lysobacter sp. cf310]SFK31128.1 Protein of unknown function [Lysobacter sp. cf310]